MLVHLRFAQILFPQIHVYLFRQQPFDNGHSHTRKVFDPGLECPVRPIQQFCAGQAIFKFSAFIGLAVIVHAIKDIGKIPAFEPAL